jgi:hypothetical protein
MSTHTKQFSRRESPHRFRFVTLPSIKGTLVIVALYEVLIGLTGGGPGTATTVIGYFIWSETFKILSYGRGVGRHPGADLASCNLDHAACLAT